MRVLLTFLAGLGSYLLHAQQCYVFIGSYNEHKHKNGIYVYKLDTASGQLSRLSTVKNILNPAYLDISPDGGYIYVCTEAHIAGGGKVSSFSLNAAEGTLTFINDRESKGENPVHLTVHKNGKWLVNSNYTGGNLSVFPLGNNGKIESATQIITFSDSSINKERQGHSHIHAGVFSPNQDYMFFPDLGADKIRCFTFEPLKQTPLQPASPPSISTVPGSGPRHFVFHPNGRFCYCIEELSGTISAYSYDDGKLVTTQRIAAHKNSDADGYHSADIHISPDGLFLYASNRGDENNIAIFSVSLENGHLTNVGYNPTCGDHPRSFAIDPSGRFVLVANQISGDVIVFKRDAATGMLNRVGKKTKVPGVSCVKIRYYPQSK